MSTKIFSGDCLEALAFLPSGSAHTCVTSPPYFGLRDYGHAGQIGLEPTPDEYVAKMVEVFREVRRVLRDDGTLWLNLGDSYSRSPAKGGSGPNGKNEGRWGYGAAQSARVGSSDGEVGRADRPGSRTGGLGEKQLLGIPWRVAFALQADGWYLRQDIIWHKPNPMPESVMDRCTKAHEYLFLLSKRPRYYYDSDAVKEPAANAGVRVSLGGKSFSKRQADGAGVAPSGNANSEYYDVPEFRNRRSVWTIATKPFKGAHFATFPPALIEPCILAGTSDRGCCPRCGAPWSPVVERGESDYARLKREQGHEWTDMDAAGLERGVITRPVEGGQTRNANGSVPSLKAAVSRTTGWRPTCACPAHDPVPCTVLDPFGGAGTTGLVANQYGRNAILCELNRDYAEMARARIGTARVV